MICVSLVPASAEDALSLMARAFPVADLVELRIDRIPHSELPRLIRARTGILAITNRTSREGGFSDAPDEERVARLMEAVRLGADYVDVELATDPSLIAAVRKVIAETGGRTKLILSYHALTGTPEASVLEERLAKAQALGADVAKIITLAKTPDDCFRTLDLHAAARRIGQPIVAFCMGELGRESRILSLRLGSAFGYAALEQGAESAPGQWTVTEMRTYLDRLEFGAKREWGKTRRYGIFGNPVSHSLSPLLHNTAFASLHIRAHYEPYRIGSAQEGIDLIRRNDLQGASVTLPFKTDFLSLLDDVDDHARKIGAINTILVQNDRLVGTNTDWTGLVRCIEEYQPLSGQTVAILGAGGAARAAVYAVQQRGGRPVVVCRSPEKGHRLAADFGCWVQTFDDLISLKADGLINTTPVGMAPHHNDTPVDKKLLKAFPWVMDMIYTPVATRLISEAREAGCRAIPGLSMFLHQGAEQFRLWTGRQAPLPLLKTVVAEALAWRAAG